MLYSQRILMSAKLLISRILCMYLYSSWQLFLDLKLINLTRSEMLITNFIEYTKPKTALLFFWVRGKWKKKYEGIKLSIKVFVLTVETCPSKYRSSSSLNAWKYTMHAIISKSIKTFCLVSLGKETIFLRLVIENMLH